jgi:hypothetical protein
MVQAPKNTILSIEEMYENYVKNILISERQMEYFHEGILKYYAAESPTFLIRKVKDYKRGLVHKNALENQIKPTDNSPSWWLHYQLYHNKINEYINFSEFIDSVPCHMFNIKIKGHISHAGWHVAHIFSAKDHKTNVDEWDRDELLKRALRNIHPCNYFYLPKTNWQNNGGDSNVIAYFYDKFKQKYSTVFEEFESIVNPDGQRFELPQPEIFIDNFEQSKETKTEAKKASSSLKVSSGKKAIKRLTFYASEIDKLANQDSFEIITDNGTFRMTKKEFYFTFKNVAESKSYRVGGLYHYPKTPKKALQYLIKK